MQWYDIRDYFLGDNMRKQDIKYALNLASTCEYPDARLLTEIFAGKDVTTKAEARAVLLEREDALSLCFSASFGNLYYRESEEDGMRLRRSADLGYAFALTRRLRFVREVDDAKRNLLEQIIDRDGERDAFFLLSQLRIGFMREPNNEELELCLVAAKLGKVDAQVSFGSYLSFSDPQRWHWWAAAARRGLSSKFLMTFADQVELCKKKLSLAPVLFAIGRALKGHVDLDGRTIFGDSTDFKWRNVPAIEAINFFTFQCTAARKAVDTWCLIARRLNGIVNRDIRKKIGLLIWEARDKANYEE